jgi:outer membrane protein OmpA-like peptidoglycan-associated protein
MRLAALAALATLAACGREAAEPAESAQPAEPATAAARAQPATPASSLGSGSRLSGAVSGLSGEITALQVEETPTQIIVELAADVLFAFDSDRLRAAATEQLQKTVQQIARGGRGPITVIGHTDSQGDDAYYDALSLRRARAVAAWLSGTGGVTADRLTSEGRGEREPVAPNAGTEGNDYPEGRAMNRRVVVVIPKA